MANPYGNDIIPPPAGVPQAMPGQPIYGQQPPPPYNYGPGYPPAGPGYPAGGPGYPPQPQQQGMYPPGPQPAYGVQPHQPMGQPMKPQAQQWSGANQTHVTQQSTVVVVNGSSTRRNDSISANLCSATPWILFWLGIFCCGPLTTIPGMFYMCSRNPVERAGGIANLVVTVMWIVLIIVIVAAVGAAASSISDDFYDDDYYY